MQANQNKDLITFITAIQLEADGSISTSPLDENLPVISKFFTPNIKVSILSTRVQNLLKASNSEIVPTTDVVISDLMKAIKGSNLKYNNPNLYRLLQTVLLESFSVIYAIEKDESLQVLINKKDAMRIHENINYVLEMVGLNTDIGESSGYNLIHELRAIDTDILYILSVLGGTVSEI